ncbi:hypothetical protein BHM03_00061938 [Ensete ventricosum]|nr:hypothetical protein BHM03_00061938 [Ensete ventricosum]
MFRVLLHQQRRVRTAAIDLEIDNATIEMAWNSGQQLHILSHHRSTLPCATTDIKAAGCLRLRLSTKQRKGGGVTYGRADASSSGCRQPCDRPPPTLPLIRGAAEALVAGCLFVGNDTRGNSARREGVALGRRHRTTGKGGLHDDEREGRDGGNGRGDGGEKESKGGVGDEGYFRDYEKGGAI